MAQKQSPKLQATIGRLAQAHFFYVLAFALSIVVYDSWKLITPQAVLDRWTVAAVMLVTTTAIWYVDRAAKLDQIYDKVLISTFVFLDIFVASFLVYAERGMASRAVALYAIPLVVSAFLKSRNAIFATASLCVAAYSFAAVRYFVVFFNEGFKIELYGTIGLYSAMFFVLAALLSLLVRNQK
jgi:predicted dinucleotide-binding enzyme